MMHLSAKTEYACRALLELALHWPDPVPVGITEISQRQGIPVDFLIQILMQLRQTGFVESTRGKKGGYLLARSPKQIFLRDVVLSLEHKEKKSRPSRANASQKVFTEIWKEIEGLIGEKMAELNFEAICHKKRRLDNTVSFDI